MRKNKFEKLVLCYAYALFELSNEELEIVEKDIQFLLSFFTNEKEVVSFFLNPVNSAKIKSDVISLLKNYINNTLLNFILLIINNRRFFLLETIFEKFLTLVKKFKNKIDIVVTSAFSLSKSDIKLINNSISSFGEVVGFTNIVDSSILGGFIIKVDFTVIDASLKSYLGRLLDVSKEAIL
ncbi:MAG: ATP synthase subunit delta [Candidatus Mesenet longicola]|uniref:ATP synthase subunit delta n=1 Tax=Candidatus Mesenet longicola TaxID=1892558 RepID=A0A8J3HX27_9RICK|nr:MAG: ATP synthase subunit delta [Candidatus Mesenet longicola]GHM59176.1 MAG: ATP synthase subunit delta [Candidatus Mesenet longicola]